MSNPENAHSHVPEFEHRHGERFGGRKKVPTVQKYTSEERRKREEVAKQQENSVRKGLSRVVRDPITGGQVQIKDSSGDYRHAAEDMHITTPRRNVTSPDSADLQEVEFNSEGTHLSELREDPETEQHENRFGKFITGPLHMNSRSSSSLRRNAEDSKSQRSNGKQKQRDSNAHTSAHDEEGWVDLPMRGQRSNVLFYTLPDPDFDQHHRNVLDWFAKLPLFIFCSECFRYFIIDFGRLTAIVLYLLVGYWIKEQMSLSWHATKLDAVKRRADQALAKRVPESVEWLNSVVAAVWKQINPDIFKAAADKLEDIMQSSAPSIIHAVKIDDVGHGDHPVRLLSMRYLDSQEIEQDQNNTSANEHPGDFVNVEVTAAYASTPSKSGTASRVRNMHLLIIFYGGLANVLGVPIPIWTEVEGFIAHIRLRFQFTPGFPYIKNTTFSLMGLPHFDISIVPISKKLLNISNIPLISTFVKMSMKAALNEYVAPKSYTIDIGKLLVGNGIAYETLAIGVVVVHIERAVDLEGQDKTGLSDPYIVVAMSNYGKPLFSSRIIEKTVNPVFHETCFVLVTPEALRSKERLSLQLWNSVRVAADGENGRVEFDLQDLVRNAGDTDEREDSLVSSVEGKTMSGKLKWSVGYFSKRKCNEELATDGSDANLADDIKNQDDIKRRYKPPDPVHAKPVVYCPPDKEWPSGILRIQLHHAVDLYANTPKGSRQPNMHYKQGQDTTEPEIEEDEAQSPSAYCNIMLNDQTIYRTRTKPFSNIPYFNAGTERFVRDWQTAVCLVSVRDSRTREHDALLGVIPLKLSEVFKNASQVTKNYPVIGGVGEAKLKISLLWESVEYRLPKNLLGWDVGNFRIVSSQIKAVNLTGDAHHLKNMKLKLFTSAASTTLSGRRCHSKDGELSWSTNVSREMPLELPTIRRHSSAFCVEFHSSGRLHAYAVAICWLTEILDDDQQILRLKIWRTDTDEKRATVRQNKIKQIKDHEDIECIGILEFEAVFLRGLGDSHESQIHTDTNLRQSHEAWQAAVAHARRNASDAYLVDRKTAPSGMEVDPYNALNNEEKLDHSSDKREVNGGPSLEHRLTDVVDDDARETTDVSAALAMKLEQKHRDIHEQGAKLLQPNKVQTNGHVDIAKSESSHSIDTTMWDESWARQYNIGKPIGEEAEELNPAVSDRRGSIAVQKYNRHSAMFSMSDTTSVTDSVITRQTSAAEAAGRHKTRKAEREKEDREQRGSQQFKPLRTMKWAKDGLSLGTAKVMDKMKKRSVRRPDTESEM